MTDDNRRCTGCIHHSDSVLFNGTPPFHVVTCHAPVPAFADFVGPDRRIGERAAKYCEAYRKAEA